MIFEQLLEVVAALFFCLSALCAERRTVCWINGRKISRAIRELRSFESTNDTEITEDKMHFDQEYETQRLRQLFTSAEQSNELDAELLRSTVAEVLVTPQLVKLRLKNGQTIGGGDSDAG